MGYIDTHRWLEQFNDDKRLLRKSMTILYQNSHPYLQFICPNYVFLSILHTKIRKYVVILGR